MEYFKYLNSNTCSPDIVYELYSAVQDCKFLALKLYGSRHEDVMDTVYEHALVHFDPIKGSAKNYVIKLISNMGKNDYKKEVYDDTVMEVSSDNKSISDFSESKEFLEFSSDEEFNLDTKACIKALVPMLIKDADWFLDMNNSSKRKMNYKSILNSFSISVVKQALGELFECKDDISYINALSKECHYRRADSDRYLKSLEKTLIYRNTINNIVVCTVNGMRKGKYVYKLDIDRVVSSFINMFYSEQGVAYREICGLPIYCTLSGNLCYSLDTIRTALEQDMVGAILAQRTNLKVLHYEKKKEILLTSSREDEPSFILNIFKVGVTIPFEKLSLKKLKR